MYSPASRRGELGTAAGSAAAKLAVVEHPVVELAVVVELHRADRVRDVLEGVLEAVREVVQGVDAPRVALPEVMRVANAIEHRVAHEHVRRREIDLRPQHVRPVLEVTGAHPPEEIEVLLHRTISIGPGHARLVDRAATLADGLQRLRVDVREPLPDERLGTLVHAFEVVRREVQVLTPVEAQPTDVALHGVHELLVFRLGVRVVVAEVAASAELGGDAEVQVDRHRVADVEVAVRLGWEARHDAPPVAAALQVGGDLLADEIRSGAGRGFRLVHSVRR